MIPRGVPSARVTSHKSLSEVAQGRIVHRIPAGRPRISKKDSSSSLRSLLLRMRGARKTSPLGMALPGAPFPLACRHCWTSSSRFFPSRFPAIVVLFGIGRIIGRLFLVTSLFSQYLVLVVLTATQPFFQHINFGAVLICSFGLPPCLGMFPVEHQVRSSCLQAQFPTLGHWNPEVGKLGPLEPQKFVSGPADHVFGDPNRVKETPDEEQVHHPSVSDVSRPRAPTQEPVQGTVPRNGLQLFRYPLGGLRRSLRRRPPWPSCSWRLRRPGWLHVGCRYSFWSLFSRGSKGGAVPQFQSG